MDVKVLKDQLLRKKETVWKKRKIEEINEYCKSYAEFMDNSKTERLSVKNIIALLEKNGYKSFESIKKTGKLPKNAKVYFSNRGKSLFAIRVKGDIKNGVNIVGAHVDSPRLDLKPEPIIEDYEIAMAKTHYYGGIKKYQWLNIPLQMYGTIVKKDGSIIDISIGDKPEDPIFVISDLLPHLDRREGDVKKVFEAEKLNILLGSVSVSYDEDIKEGVKLNVLKILNEKYGIVEEDFISAEIEVVPAFNSRDVGLDRSLIASYGHDDRVFAYTALSAIIEAEPKFKSSALIIADKEEIGSEGNTGSKNHYWIGILKELLSLQKEEVSLAIEETLRNSVLLSADVSAAVDPNYKDVHDLTNAPKLGYGIVITKYTGSGGKGATNDANAELVGKIRKILNDSNVTWQTGELGRTDLGGGGTIAKFFAEKGLDVIDAGVPLLGMHAPYEIASKADIYETYLAYKAFMESMD